MHRFRHLPGVLAAMLLPAVAPLTAGAQQGSIVTTATVVARPLMLRAVEHDVVPGRLRVTVDGCGTGALTVHARAIAGLAVRLTQQVITASARCERQEFLVTLTSEPTSGTESWDVALVQGDGLLAPAVSQFVISAAATRTSGRNSLFH